MTGKTIADEELLGEIRDIMDEAEIPPAANYQTAPSETVRDWFVSHSKSKDARLRKRLGV